MPLQCKVIHRFARKARTINKTSPAVFCLTALLPRRADVDIVVGDLGTVNAGIVNNSAMAVVYQTF